MSSSGIPEDARKFIAKHINSVEQLEILLLLHAHPQREWTADAVAQELRTDPKSAAMRLDDLRTRGLLSVASNTDHVYQYAPASVQMAHAVDLLKEAYAERRVSVIEFIFSRPVDNIRVFADAFRIKKDD